MRRALYLLFAASITIPAQTIHVDDDAAPGGDGSARRPFHRLQDAVAEANSRSKAPVIQMAPGTYELTETLKIENSMTINGSSELEFDFANLPTGRVADPSTETRIVASPELQRLMISVGKDGAVIRDVKLRRLVMQNSATNPNILDFSRVQNYEVRDCIFLGFGELASSPGSAINSFASSGMIRSTYTTRLLGAAFMAAGYPESPAKMVFRQNRAVGNRVGIFLQGTSDGIFEPGDQLEAEVRNNDLSGNFQQRASAGIRILTKGPETVLGPGYGFTGLATGNIRAVIQRNRLVGNKFGIVIDGGFVLRRVAGSNPPVCDTRVYRGQFDLTFRENELAESTFRPAVITFTNFQATLGILEGAAPNFTMQQFQHFSTYNIGDRQNLLGGAVVQHPANDPFTGPPCEADTTSEQLHNVLRINGTTLPNAVP